jgi:hypothetical protein
LFHRDQTFSRYESTLQPWEGVVAQQIFRMLLSNSRGGVNHVQSRRSRTRTSWNYSNRQPFLDTSRSLILVPFHCLFDFARSSLGYQVQISPEELAFLATKLITPVSQTPFVKPLSRRNAAPVSIRALEILAHSAPATRFRHRISLQLAARG